MIDPRLLAEQPDLVKDHLRRRNADDSMLADVDAIAAAHAERRTHVTERDDLRARRNTLSKEIGGLYKAGKRDEAEAAKAEVQAGNERIKVIEEQIDALEADIAARALSLPNLRHDDVQDGASEDDTVEVNRWGEPTELEFEPKDHVEVGTNLGILDLERATKLCGARFAILKGAGARLERALINFFLDVHTSEHGYEETMTPYMVWADVCEGTGQLPKFGKDMFKLAEPVNGQDAYLISTAEIPVTNIHRGEILEEEQLPIKSVAFTPCFRSEAGAAGRDTRGIIRQHQFHKVELVWVTTPERAEEDHKSLVRHAEVILEKLGLPYRTMRLSSGDIGFGAHICYDLEVWLPSQQKYREISSCSWYGDFQSRRMKLRYRPEPVDGGKKQKPKLTHTLNGSGLAVGRTLVAILENYQRGDGAVVIPEALRPYMGGLEVIEAPRDC
jgi:seryl-tRNA synthetase